MKKMDNMDRLDNMANMNNMDIPADNEELGNEGVFLHTAESPWDTSCVWCSRGFLSPKFDNT